MSFAEDPTKAKLAEHLIFNRSTYNSEWFDVFLAVPSTQKMKSLTDLLGVSPYMPYMWVRTADVPESLAKIQINSLFRVL